MIIDDVEIEIVYRKEEGIVYIGTPTSSGVKYECNTIEQLKKSIITYIEDYIDYEKKSSKDEFEIEK